MSLKNFIQYDTCKFVKANCVFSIIWHIRLMFSSEGRLPCTMHCFTTLFGDIVTVRSVFFRVNVTGDIL